MTDRPPEFSCRCLRASDNDRGQANHIDRYWDETFSVGRPVGIWAQAIRSHEEAHRLGAPHDHLQVLASEPDRCYWKIEGCDCHLAADQPNGDFGGRWALNGAGMLPSHHDGDDD